MGTEAAPVCEVEAVAGLRAGLIYNTFPLMGGTLVPAEYAQLHPFIRNWFENLAAIQFDHRLLAMTTFAVVLALWFAGLRAALPKPACVALHTLLAAVALQVALGISTLLLVVPISRPLSPGRYSVRWHAVSVDTHRTEGAFQFTVK